MTGPWLASHARSQVFDLSLHTSGDSSWVGQFSFIPLT